MSDDKDLCQENLGVETPPSRIVSASIVIAPAVGPEPANVICPSCKAQMITAMELHTNTRTHIVALMLCGLLCIPCVWMPYFCISCQDTVHRCPQCKAFIGVYTR